MVLFRCSSWKCWGLVFGVYGLQADYDFVEMLLVCVCVCVCVFVCVRVCVCVCDLASVLA
jgi:hypothetical protein